MLESNSKFQQLKSQLYYMDKIAKFKVILILIMLIFTACDKTKVYTRADDSRLKISNISNKYIYFSFSDFYPDTLKMYPISPSMSYYKVKSNETKTYNSKETWEDFFQNRIVSSGKLFVFIYDAQTIESIPFDTIQKKYMILKRFDLTYNEIVQKNWIITYP
jgi:hypothetical protein